jgi:hypothetical protein
MLYRLLPAILVPFALPAQDPVIQGVYLEERSNRVHGCYCEWSGESQTGGREAIMAWRVTSGRFLDVDLSGVAMALVVRGDASLSFGSAGVRSVLAIDSAAPAQQARAAARFVRERYGAFAGPSLTVLSLPVAIQVDDAAASVRVPGRLALQLRKAILPEDALPGAVRWFGPFFPLVDPVLATTILSRYSGDEFNYRWSRAEPGTNGYFGRFIIYSR